MVPEGLPRRANEGSEMRFRFTISGTYELLGHEAKAIYGTTDLQEVTTAESERFNDSPDDLLWVAESIEVKVEPDLQAEAEEGYKEVTQ
jgi:hypothetical protein